MGIENIFDLLVAVLPALTSIVSVVAVAVRILRKFTALNKEFKDKTDYQEVQKCMSKLLDENLELKKEIKRLQTTIDRVHRE